MFQLIHVEPFHYLGFIEVGDDLKIDIKRLIEANAYEANGVCWLDVLLPRPMDK